MRIHPQMFLASRFAILDVRPAMNSWENVWDRMKVFYMRWRYEWEDRFAVSQQNKLEQEKGA